MLPSRHSQRSTAFVRNERSLKSSLSMSKASLPSVTVCVPFSLRAIVVPFVPYTRLSPTRSGSSPKLWNRPLAANGSRYVSSVRFGVNVWIQPELTRDLAQVHVGKDVSGAGTSRRGHFLPSSRTAGCPSGSTADRTSVPSDRQGEETTSRDPAPNLPFSSRPPFRSTPQPLRAPLRFCSSTLHPVLAGVPMMGPPRVSRSRARCE